MHIMIEQETVQLRRKGPSLLTDIFLFFSPPQFGVCLSDTTVSTEPKKKTLFSTFPTPSALFALGSINLLWFIFSYECSRVSKEKIVSL